MRNQKFLRKLFTVGTPHCAAACALAGVFIALIALWAGIWRALLVVAVVAIGAFIGGVKEKKQFFHKFIKSDSSHLN